MRFDVCALTISALLAAAPTVVRASEATITIDSPMTPPSWALLERELLRANTDACQAFFAKYFDERGYLQCVERWGGDDGPDDAIENVADWPILHALGAPNSVLQMYKRAWEGHLRQYTEAKTAKVPFARDGMYYKEFPCMMDWAGDPIEVQNRFHLGHGERNYEEMVAHFKDYNDIIGAHVAQHTSPDVGPTALVQPYVATACSSALM